MQGQETGRVLTVSDDLPVAVARPVHSGKVRSVYFLSPEVSQRLSERRSYNVAPHSALALMVISDRLSAFDCLWHGETLAGVPGKGAALNRIAAHWFRCFAEAGLPPDHLVEVPHPMLWVVRQAQPLRIEAIARRYLTGSLWRAYERGQRRVGGVNLPEKLTQYGRLPQLLFTPSTKGVIDGVPGVPAVDDTPVDPAILRAFPESFGMRAASDVDACEEALTRGFAVIEAALEKQGDMLVDTKFEFGLAPAREGGEELIYLDEVGTPDSSRIWRREDWEQGPPREHSKEQFREALLSWVPDRDMLLNPARIEERTAFARATAVPDEFLARLGETYAAQARAITGEVPPVSDDPRGELLDVLSDLGVLC